jgi:hypothetical protein
VIPIASARKAKANITISYNQVNIKNNKRDIGISKKYKWIPCRSNPLSGDTFEMSNLGIFEYPLSCVNYRSKQCADSSSAPIQAWRVLNVTF